MKVTLINPPFLFPSKNEIVFSQCLGLRSISSFLKQTGVADVTFIDSLMTGFDSVKKYHNGFLVGLESADIIGRIPKDSELIGISAPFSQLAPIVHDLVQLIKLHIPASKVVLGGVYPSTQPELALTSTADFIVVGEGETAMARLAGGDSPDSIAGVYRTGRFYSDYQNADAIKNLDTLPYPDYSIPNIEKYFSLSQRMRKGRTASIVTSRGCPFSCEFCSISPVYGRKYRARSALHVLREIEYLIDRFAINELEIEDDNFTLRRDRTVEILEGIIRLNEKGAQLSWNTPNGIRIDTLDEGLIQLIKRSNCSSITLALEHGDGEMLNIMNKKLSLDTAYDAVRMLVKYEIPQIGLFVIVGYPGETKERFEKSLHFLRKLRALGSNVQICANNAQPYPGTRLLKRCFDEGYIKDENTGNFLVNKGLMSTGHFVSITTPDFDAAEVLRRREEILNIFRPPWKRTLKAVLPSSVLSYARQIKRNL